MSSPTMLDAGGARDGDPDAWRRLEARLRPWLLDLLRGRRLPRGHTADDLVAITFAEMYQSLARFDFGPGAKLRSWVATILLNNLADLIRRDRAAKRGSGPDLPLHGSDSRPGVDVPDRREPPPSAAARSRELHADIRRFLADLPEEHRRIVELRLADELDFATIAARVGRNKPVTVKVIFHRIMKKLRAWMGDR